MDGPCDLYRHIGIHRLEDAFDVVATIGRHGNHRNDGFVHIHRHGAGGFAGNPITVGMNSECDNTWSRGIITGFGDYLDSKCRCGVAAAIICG